MDKNKQDKEKLSHMENRTQWHQKDVDEVEALRNKVAEASSGEPLSQEQKESNKVKHKH